ncbi:MAG TPA: carboxypeptidase regulatory-like domain-containing protein [Bryobacteraceae bacterium]|nr:carboxypeptidase regulatory-like domain-containing protein [Bryobacteraceae bacterium]
MSKPVMSSLVALFALVPAGFAQNLATGTLVGTVTDASGGVVTNATVTVTDTQTQVASRAVTNAQGSYYVPFLNVGNYQLTVEAPGFKKFEQSGIAINVGETPRIDVKLQVGAITEQVKVTAAAPLLETDTAVVGQVDDTKTVHDIPMMQAKAQNLMYYMEGAQVNYDGTFHILGLPPNNLNYSIDGSSIKQSVRSAIGETTTSITPPVDSIAEAQVWTTGVPAEVGHTAGGSYNMVLKSGTNELHFSAEERYINKDWLHRSYFQQASETSPFEYHMFFSTLGGPIVIPKVYNGRNKSFFFLSYGLNYDHEQNPVFTSTPDAGMLSGNFSFGGLGLPIYDPKSITCPATANGCPNGVGYTATQFPGNQIPLNRFDPVTAKFLSMNPYNTPNTAGFFSNTGPNNNYTDNTHYLSDREGYIGRIDQQITSDHKMFFRFAWNMNREPIGRNAVQYRWGNLDNTEFSFGQREPIDLHNFTLGDIYNFGPTLINEFRVSYQRRADTIQPALDNQGWAAILGIPGVGPQTFPGFVGASGGSSVTWTANPSGTSNPAGNLQTVNDDFELNESLTKVIGRHTFKAGYQMIFTREDDIQVSQPSGTYNFTTAGSGLPNTPNTGNTFASFLLGAVSSATFTTLLQNYLPRWWSHQFFVQDDWRAAHNLTVSLGLRYSYESPAQTKYGFKSEFNPNVVDPLTGMMGAITHPKGAVYGSDLSNFTPRVGVSWNFKPKWVYRGSFGMFTVDVMPELGQDEYLATAAVQPPPGNPFPAFYLSQGPGPVVYNINPNTGTANYVGTNYSNRTATYIDPSLRNPYTMTWSSGLQWEFRANQILEAVYQGSSGVGLIGTTNINVLPESIYNSTNTTLLNQVYSATQNYLAYPQFGTITATGNYGHSTYHALVTRLERRYSSGFRYNILFTWSKNILGTAGTGWQYYDWNLTKGVAPTDIRLQLSPTASYDLPVGKNRRFMNRGGILDYLFGGWTFLTIQSLRSGLPVTFTMAGSPYKYLPGETQPNIVAGQSINVPNYSIGTNLWPENLQNPFFNIRAFSYPAAFTGGNAGVSIARAGAVWWPQYSLSKTVAFRERYKLMVRVDLNNLLPETRWLQSPNTTVNITSPQTFGRFAPATGTSFSAFYTPSGHLIGILRLEF